MPRPHRSRLLGLAACVTPVLASAAWADNLIEIVPGPDPGSYVAVVNGTPGSDAIQLVSLLDGSVLVVRISPLDIRWGVISAADVASDVVLVKAGDGNDLVDASAAMFPGGLEIRGGNGDDILIGSNGPDTIWGDDPDLPTASGNDLIYGLGGNDTIDGGPGFGDMIFGNDGFDSITDPDGVAYVDGGEGDDTISIVFSAAWDNDRISTNQRRSVNRIFGGGGNDTVTLIIQGSPILFAVDGDGGTLYPGTVDEIDTFGSVAAGSVFRNFEVTNFNP